MPGYVAEGKQQLAIAVGCTGGQHRCVALAESTGEYLKAQGYRVSVAHRDLGAGRGLCRRAASTADPRAAARGPATAAAPDSSRPRPAAAPQAGPQA